jgi:hypothetical protein
LVAERPKPATPKRPRKRAAPATPASRPLRQEAADALAQRFVAALDQGDGLAGAHCVHEWWMRGEFAARIEAAQQQLWARCAASIPEWLPMHHVSWLATAYDVAAQFKATGRGRSNIYLVLLDNSERRGDAHGVYVGMSRYSPAQRFDQHKAGIRAAGCVLKRGIEVLTGPVLHLQKIGLADARRIEAALAEALSDAGIRSEGGH